MGDSIARYESVCKSISISRFTRCFKPSMRFASPGCSSGKSRLIRSRMPRRIFNGAVRCSAMSMRLETSDELSICRYYTPFGYSLQLAPDRFLCYTVPQMDRLPKKHRCPDSEHQWHEWVTPSGKKLGLCKRCGESKVLYDPTPKAPVPETEKPWYSR
jgi:hypothetical protein